MYFYVRNGEEKCRNFKEVLINSFGFLNGMRFLCMFCIILVIINDVLERNFINFIKSEIFVVRLLR